MKTIFSADDTGHVKPYHILYTNSKVYLYYNGQRLPCSLHENLCMDRITVSDTFHFEFKLCFDIHFVLQYHRFQISLLFI